MDKIEFSVSTPKMDLNVKVSSNGDYIVDVIPPIIETDLASLASPTNGSSPLTHGNIVAAWVNSGEDKVTQDETRARNGVIVENALWDGQAIHLGGARNEIVNFNLILETDAIAAENVRVEFDFLKGDGYYITSKRSQPDDVCNWVNRNIELFYVRYLPIKGLSLYGYLPYYDERHVPAKLRRPHDEGRPRDGTGWHDRPNAGKFYPDIAVPMEWHPEFTIEADHNQAIWCDVYIPEDAPAGIYKGMVRIYEGENLTKAIPVNLDVWNITLPDESSAKTMAWLNYDHINLRYFGNEYPNINNEKERLDRIRDRHFMLAKRHRVSLIDLNWGDKNPVQQTEPNTAWKLRLSGDTYTYQNGYVGPGANVGNDVFVIGGYGQWRRWVGDNNAQKLQDFADAWEDWFEAHYPEVERMLYLIDESYNYTQMNRWAKWMNSNSGTGRALRSFVTGHAPEILEHAPEVDMVASFKAIGKPADWEHARAHYATNGKGFYAYNGSRPFTGSFMIEDEGTSPRMIPWTQMKLDIQRWFFWDMADYQNPNTKQETNVFRQAQTNGHIADDRDDMTSRYGEWGDGYNNGDGVMIYPGTDKVFPEESYEHDVPIASLRLKFWRRGLQDAEYIALARAIDPERTHEIINSVIPQVMWELDVEDEDPFTPDTDIMWAENPDDWETARRELATIILGG